MSYIAHIDVEMSDGVTQRTHNRIMRKILLQEGKNHLYKTLGKHFKNVPETQPGGAYRYEPRDSRWQEVKRRRFGHNLPNVATGRMRNGIRNMSHVRATPGKFTIYVRAPLRRTSNGRNFSMTRQQRREITIVSRQEVAQVQTRAIAQYQGEVLRPENQRKRKRRI